MNRDYMQPVAWTEREIELIDEMIEVQLIHSERLDSIPNRAMADKQKGWNMERVALLQKIKAAPPAAPAPDAQPAIYPEEAREMGLEEVPYYTHPPVEDVRPVAYETENELWWHDAPDINDYIRSTGIPLYRHPPAADVQVLVQALKEIIEHCPNSWAEIRADVALKIWEGK